MLLSKFLVPKMLLVRRSARYVGHSFFGNFRISLFFPDSGKAKFEPTTSCIFWRSVDEFSEFNEFLESDQNKFHYQSIWLIENLFYSFCRIKRLAGQNELTLLADVELLASVSEPSWVRPPIELDFHVRCYIYYYFLYIHFDRSRCLLHRGWMFDFYVFM